eukprot:TRINITY_DN13264_c0_g1_i1.p1 TRINITY_DN13264_c0_g1~~TRINITY_DN13264_c0_g1_i1.p1  ORF type:complete len:175 (-),score=1.40 TRINITY_DN13264_c0_g1_i1:28-552(-)
MGKRARIKSEPGLEVIEEDFDSNAFSGIKNEGKMKIDKQTPTYLMRNGTTLLEEEVTEIITSRRISGEEVLVRLRTKGVHWVTPDELRDGDRNERVLKNFLDERVYAVKKECKEGPITTLTRDQRKAFAVVEVDSTWVKSCSVCAYPFSVLSQKCCFAGLKSLRLSEAVIRKHL